MSTIGTQPQTRGFAFVLNVLKLIGADYFEIADNHHLRRASAEEITRIRTQLELLVPYPWINQWENRLHPGAPVEQLEEKDWRYFVIAFTGTNQTIAELEQTFTFSKTELQVGITFVQFESGGGYGTLWQGQRLSRQVGMFSEIEFLEVDHGRIAEIRSSHSQLLNHNEGVLEIRRIVQQFLNLQAVAYAPSLFLGHFGILEALLTHKPNPSDPYSSITRQVKKKLALLNNRSPNAIDYGNFGNAPPDTVWERMYGYRSRLAHGGDPTFDADFQVLKTPEKALDLLIKTVKLVIRQALAEPQLVADLRNC